MKKIILIGGASIDYIATSDVPLIHEVSNDGSLSMSFGGVSCNVCYNLSKLGNKITFITSIGNDTNGTLIKNHLKELDVTFYTPETKFPSSTYVAINDVDHDMALAIFDNRIEKEITPEFLMKHDDLIKKFDFIVLDANLSTQTIDYIVNKYSEEKKIFCEAISPQLVLHYKNVLDKIYLLKCNIHEARSLVHNSPLSGEDLIKALFKRGLKNVVVSNNKFDIYYGINGTEVHCFPIKPHTHFKNTTGCGDALFSGIIDQLSLGKDFHEAIKFGNKLSNITLMSDGANSPEIINFAHEKD